MFDVVPYQPPKGPEITRPSQRMRHCKKRGKNTGCNGKGGPAAALRLDCIGGEGHSTGGVDFGGWVQHDMNNPESLQSLRYEQFVPILIKAVQEHSAG
jgi:hypothetical protein